MNNYCLRSKQDLLLRYHLDEVVCIEISPNEKFFATGGFDSYFLLWELSSPIKLVSERYINASVINIKFHPQGKYVACGSQDYLTIYLYDITHPNQPRVVYYIINQILLDECGLIFTKNSHYFINSRHVYHLSGKKILNDISIHSTTGDYLRELSISHNEKLILAYYSTCTIRIFKFPQLKVIYQQNAFQSLNITFYQMKFTNYDDTVIAINDSILSIWNITDLLKDKSKMPIFNKQLFIFPYNLECTLCPEYLRRQYNSSAICFTKDQQLLIFPDNWEGQIVVLRNNKTKLEVLGNS